MADRLASGNVVHKFSQRTTEEVEAALTDLEAKIQNASATINSTEARISPIEQLCQTNAMNIHDLVKDVNILDNRVNRYLIPFYYDAYPVLYRILLSRPMRFINYFAKWYMIDLIENRNKEHPYFIYFCANNKNTDYKARMKAYRVKMKELKKSGITLKKLVDDTLDQLPICD